MRKASLLFGVMVIAQWLLPWWTIRDSERILREGTAFKFRTAPIDPHDPFRGEYVTLQFDLEAQDLRREHDPHAVGDVVCVVLAEVNGEAAIDRVLREAPANGGSHLMCEVAYVPYDDSTLFRIDLPFDRFYLEEGSGRRTEELIDQRRVETGPELPAYAVVRVLDGRGVIEDLIVGDRSIHDWLKENPEASP
ncbi:MAG TPA: GDYXXLXY domain-containing protein [Flavobacteriales bacterium]|nr:GDYXXLXY domain-containing protein [Flavobacteriales bacterium]